MVLENIAKILTTGPRLADMGHGLATLISHNFVVMVRNIKCGYSVFLARTSGILWDQNWADYMKISVLQQNRIPYTATPSKELC